MATVLRNVAIVVDGTPLTEDADEVTISEEADQQDSTTFGNDGYRTFERGLITGTIQVRFNQNFDPNSTHDTLYPLWVSGEEFELSVHPDGESGSDPVYVADVKLFSYSFLQGSVGEISRNPVSFQLTAPPRLNNT